MNRQSFIFSPSTSVKVQSSTKLAFSFPGEKTREKPRNENTHTLFKQTCLGNLLRREGAQLTNSFLTSEKNMTFFFSFLKWQPCHFPVIIFCLFRSIYQGFSQCSPRIMLSSNPLYQLILNFLSSNHANLSATMAGKTSLTLYIF